MAASHTAKPLAWFHGSKHLVTNRRLALKLSPFYITVLATCIAFGLDLSLGTFASEATDAFYIIAAAASAYAGGWRFGVVSVGLGLLPNVALFNSPHYSLAIGAYGWEHIIVTSIIAVILAYLVGRLRKEQHALQTLNNQLEHRVSLRTAELEESNRQLEAFCHTLAHDLRAPLRAIQGFSEITLAENAEHMSEDGKQALTRIGNSAEMMGRLIFDLLGYTAIQRTKVAVAQTSLQQVVDRALAILAPEIHEKKATVQIDAPLPVVTGDFVLLEQIVLSILTNALKFTRDNIRTEIRIWAESSASSIRLAIEDNGIGIDPQYHERIFGPFQRLDSLAKYPGTGIGLAIAKKSLERLGGKISVESHFNKGSRFWIELPNSQPTSVE
ncbi:MAG: multi-sensor signal transduction histidine kinase [Verrucomicrobiales bacterium]|nr:multi-sensor signal transduction histidine kinase [Verrucomicrobiales bacterium]